MDKYEELKLLFSKIDDYFDDAKDDYAERYRAWLKIIFNNESNRAKSEMPKVGVLKPQVLDFLRKNNLRMPTSANIHIRSGIITGPKAERHQKKNNALSPEEWKTLPADLKNPLNIYYDTNSNHIIYIVKSEVHRGSQFTVEIDYRGLQSGGGNMIVSAYKTLFKDFDMRIKRGDVIKIT